MTTEPFAPELAEVEEMLGDLWDRIDAAVKTAAGKRYGLSRAASHVEGAWRAVGYARAALND